MGLVLIEAYTATFFSLTLHGMGHPTAQGLEFIFWAEYFTYCTSALVYIFILSICE